MNFPYLTTQLISLFKTHIYFGAITYINVPCNKECQIFCLFFIINAVIHALLKYLLGSSAIYCSDSHQRQRKCHDIFVRRKSRHRCPCIICINDFHKIKFVDDIQYFVRYIGFLPLDEQGL